MANYLKVVKFEREIDGITLKREVAVGGLTEADVMYECYRRGGVIDTIVNEGWTFIDTNGKGYYADYLPKSGWAFQKSMQKAWTFERSLRKKWLFISSDERAVFYSPRRLRRYMNLIEGSFDAFDRMKVGEVRHYDMLENGKAYDTARVVCLQ